MRAGLMVLMLGVVACGPPPPQQCNVGGTGGFGGSGGEVLVVGASGKPFRVTMTVPRFIGCGPGLVADEVFTEVLDPLNRKVEHSHSAPISDQSFLTQITFTPAMPGSYHLSARFEPSVGTTQQDVQVAMVRAGPSRMLSTGVPCDALEEMANGLVLCLTPASKLRVLRDGGGLQTLDADDFAVAGNVVWTTLHGDVQRRVVVAGPTPLGPPELFNSIVTGSGTLLAREDRVIIATPSQTSFLSADGGNPVYGVSSGDRGGISVGATHDAMLLVSGGPKGSFGVGRVCAVALDVSFSSLCRNTGSQIDVLGADSTGVWSRENLDLRHDSLAPDGGIATDVVRLPGLPVLQLSRHYQSTPALSASGFTIVPRFGPEGITFDAYDPLPGFTFMPSSAGFLRAQDEAGTQQLFTR